MFGTKKSDSQIEISTVGGIPEIMETVLYADRRSAEYTSLLAPKLVGRNDRETFLNIWKFARKNVSYKIDNPGYEIVKSPGNLLQTKQGDCKSFAVFVGSILQNLGYNYFFRLIWENPLNPHQAHVYVMAETPDGTYIPIDPVNDQFGAEPFYFWFSKKDYTRESGIAGFSGGLRLKYILLILAGILLFKPKK